MWDTETEMNIWINLLFEVFCGDIGSEYRVWYLRFDLVVTEAQVLQIGRSVGLHGRELVLQHLDNFRQLWVSPAKLPAQQNGRDRERCGICTEPTHITGSYDTTVQHRGMHLYLIWPGFNFYFVDYFGEMEAVCFTWLPEKIFFIT